MASPSANVRPFCRPGVVGVYGAADLGDYGRPGPLLVPPPPIAGLVFNPCTQVPLAKDKVRQVGEPEGQGVAARGLGQLVHETLDGKDVPV